MHADREERRPPSDRLDDDVPRHERRRSRAPRGRAARGGQTQGRLGRLSSIPNGRRRGSRRDRSHRLLELLERARARIAIGSPPDELAVCRNRLPSMWSYRTSTTRSGRSGTNERSFFGFQRLPSALRGVRASAISCFPVPGVPVERRDPRLQLLEELPTAIHREGADHPDVGEHARVVEPEQERPDRIGAALVQPVPGHDAVGGALVLDLEHHALVGLVGPFERLRHTPSSPAPRTRRTTAARPPRRSWPA